MKYKQTSVTGESWVRAKRIVIENVLNEDNAIKFVEEKVTNLDGDNTSQDLGVLDNKVGDVDMSTEIPVIDPETGEPTGTSITYGELHAFIFSVYMALVNERDSTEEETVDTEASA